MIMRTFGALALASALAFTATPGHALDFDFSMSNVSGNVNGTVTGLIEGLTDNATSNSNRGHRAKLSGRNSGTAGTLRAVNTRY